MTAAPPYPSAGVGPGSPLHLPSFRWYVAGRTAVMLGNAIAPVALAFAVLDLTGSARDVGLVVAAQSITRVVFLLLGGVLADRLPRHLLLVGSCTAAGLIQGVVAAAILSGRATITLLVGLAALSGTMSAVSLPCSMAMVPQTVPVAMLRQANALARLFSNSALVAGGALGGVIVVAVGPGWGLVVDAASFVVAAGCYARVRLVRAAPPAQAQEGFLRQVREGWSEFCSRTWLWVVVLQFALLNAVGSAVLTVLGPVIADETFGRRAWGFIVAAEAVGFLVGGYLAMRHQPRRALAFGVGLMLTAALLPLGLAVDASVPLLLAAMFVIGVATEQFTVAWDVSMQENIPADRLARVYSLDALGSFVAIPVGQLAAGPIASEAGLRATLLGGAVLIVVPTLAAVSTRSVRSLERHGDREPA